MKALALCIVAFGIHFPVLAFNSTCYSPPYQGGGDEGHVALGDTPCTPSTDEDVARACCGYSDGSICLSNGLCFVPNNNSMLQGSCTDPTWSSTGCPNTKCVGMRAVLYISRWILTRFQTLICSSAKVHRKTHQRLAIAGDFGIAVHHRNLALMRSPLLASSKDTSPISETTPLSYLRRPRLRNQSQ